MCREAGTVMLSGQVADGIATIIVGRLVSPIFMPMVVESLGLSSGVQNTEASNHEFNVEYYPWTNV